MRYNSNKHTASLTTTDILAMIENRRLFAGFTLGGDGVRLSITKAMRSKVDVDLWTPSGSLKAHKVELVPLTDTYFSLRRENDTIGVLTVNDLGLEVPSGWCILGEDGLIHGDESEIARLLIEDGIRPYAIGANIESWLEHRSTVEIHGVSYSALEVLHYLDEDREEELEEECMTDYLEDYGPEDIAEDVEGLLWYWNDDNMTLTSGRFVLGGEEYAPGFEPNYHKEWES